jgi:hypothetical protein
MRPAMFVVGTPNRIRTHTEQQSAITQNSREGNVYLLGQEKQL